jgi:hypothetical protein
VSPSYKGHRYPVEVISHCVWLYFRFPLSFREDEELMLEHGIVVSYETMKFGQQYANSLRRRQPRPGDKWTHLHIALLPFPLLTLGLLVPLWHRPRPDLAGFATVVAWTSAFTYAAFYTGLDAVAGIAAGTAVEHAAGTADIGPIKYPLYDVGDSLGEVGSYALIVAVVATAVALFPKHGVRVVPGTVVLLGRLVLHRQPHLLAPRRMGHARHRTGLRSARRRDQKERIHSAPRLSMARVMCRYQPT